MIAADIGPAFEALTARLAAKAKAIAEARAEQALLGQRSDPSRWRKARLLWPLFTRG